ncbi:MAG: glycosyltransferase family 39 protein [Sorangiineae bacterium]|nr:glycosyltransferase family 39 protein [Polyangiaceae bacterium]MEB2324424.1 glycosyltransferase family 39 protein [Sorangiineae bacterium]
MSASARPPGAALAWRDGALLFVVGLAARALAVAWAASRFPPTADGHFYDVIAQRIAEGHGYTWLWPDGAVTYAAHYPVGYPALVGALYALGGPHPALAMGANALVGALAVPAVYAVAGRAASRPGALVGALLVALHPGLVFYTPALMTEGVVAALVAVAAWLAVRASESLRGPRAAWLVGLGLLLGATTMVRPQSLLLAPLFGALAIGPVSARARRLRRAALVRRSAGAALVTALAVAVCVPWTARNCARMGRCAFVSVNGGWNLYIGAAPGATGSWVSLDALGVPASCRAVFAEAEKDACFGRAALQEIARAPLRYLALAPSKLAVTFDYSGAPGWYLHQANPAAFDERDKLRLGVLETAWERLASLLALVALARAEGPRRRARGALAGLAGLWFFTRAAWVGTLGLVAVAALLGRRLAEHPPALLVAGTLALTALTHAVFFGAGRYSLVCFALLPALSGAAWRREAPRADDSSRGARPDAAVGF